MKDMKKIALAMSLIVATPPLPASISSGSGGAVVVVAVPAPKTVAVALAMPADFVSMPISVISDQKNSALAYEESRQAIEMISQKVKEKGQFQASTGVASLSQHKSSFGISSGSWSQ